VNLDTMTMDKLVAFRDEVNKVLGIKIAAERQSLEAQISKLDAASPINAIRMAPRKVPAKYRDPDTGATWAGRGRTPKWVKGNKKKYLIATQQ
jgi:DNA-binding protein H-NS